MTLFVAVIIFFSIVLASWVAYNQLHLQTQHPLPYGACRHCRQLPNHLNNHGLVEIQTEAMEAMEETQVAPTTKKN